MLHLHRSNRAECLLDALASAVRVPLADPFAAEHIVVQSKGMERWLAMELSRRLGVWANPRFPFPRHLVEDLFGRVLGDRDVDGSAFDEGALTWAIAKALPALLAEPAFAPIARYLDGDEPDARAVDLAERVAGVFDDYVVYRPEMVLGWGRGDDDDWQARLFRDLVARHGAGHPAARAHAFAAKMEAGGGTVAALPERICVFGIATLPPLHLSVLSALARRIEVHLFVLAPTREYFADMRRSRDADAREPRKITDALSAGDDSAVGPPLLTSLGRLARDFQQLLEERTSYVEDEADRFVDPGTGTALATLQSDMLHLRRRGKDGDAPPLALAADDDSISVHACHGPMREVEVLHDQLVALLRDTSLHPHDIIVLTPDIELYAPYVDAVFGVDAGRPRIPYACVRGRAEPSQEVVEAFGAILAVLAGRMEASQVLDLLGAEVIRARFDIDAAEVETARRWIAESGIRWGEDAAHREEVGQPALDANTWRFGLERMLLGYAFAGDGMTLFEGRLPYAGIEGGDAALAGKLADVCERLFEHRRTLAVPRPIAEWSTLLSGLLEALIASGPETAHQHQSLRDALATLAAHAARAGFDAPVDLPTLRRRLATLLDEALPARGFLAGSVTFCQLVPMRAIPFRVVCLLGMNDETFPRRSTVLGFDRIAEQPAPGDRSPREDDRYAFLEALLSARERLLISYVGQGVQDNRVIPPSVVVNELLDALRDAFVVSDGCSVEDRIVVRHRLQGFSPAYFSADPASRLFSYASHYFEGARSFGAERSDPVFLPHAVCAPEPTIEMTLDDFESYLTRPARAFVNKQLGVFLGEELTEVEDREPIALDALGDWKLGDEMLRQLLAGAPEANVRRALRAGGALPLGTPGQIALAEVEGRASALVEEARVWRRGAPLDPLDVSFELDGMRVAGVLRGLWPDAHLHVGYSKAGGRFELVHWVRHVLLHHALATTPRAGYPRHSVVVARDDDGSAAVVRFDAPDSAAAVLKELVAFVRAARTAPVPFFRYASRAYADARFASANPGKGLTHAETTFRETDNDPHDRLVFPSFDHVRETREPFGFVEAAERIYGPFFAHRSAP